MVDTVETAGNTQQLLRQIAKSVLPASGRLGYGRSSHQGLEYVRSSNALRTSNCQVVAFANFKV